MNAERVAKIERLFRIAGGINDPSQPLFVDRGPGVLSLRLSPVAYPGLIDMNGRTRGMVFDGSESIASVILRGWEKQVRDRARAADRALFEGLYSRKPGL